MTYLGVPLLRLFALVALVLVSGCSSLFTADRTPTNFFVLTATPAGESIRAIKDGPFVGVAPVRIPDYLNHTVIVTRTAGNELDLATFNEWAAPLAANITNVLAENLSAMIPTERVVPIPANLAIPIDYEVAVEIVNFERDADGTVQLVARWTVLGDGGRRLMAIRRSGFKALDVSMDYNAIAGAMSTLLGELSRDIAAEINAAPPRRRA
jgi:uncharacterized lipoprotein YmbA